MAKHRSSASAHKPVRKARAARTPLTDVWIYVVVFVGGSVGTALRYLLTTALNGQPHTLSIRWGTFSANMIASFAYAFLVAVLAQTLLSDQASAPSRRAGELLTRGLGMGVCGGLSTMSTLALEIAASGLGWAYASISLLAGITMAVLGALLGSGLGKILDSHGDESNHSQGRANTSRARRAGHAQVKSQDFSDRTSHRAATRQKASENSSRSRARKHRRH
ncbi:CrcB family protein [Alloscardovia omnicolens]|uniref:FluC/FEX family fluoride channel n=1 Tax=Alloscardovia omnicolens TaxID=419015 RepID=UPI003A61F042